MPDKKGILILNGILAQLVEHLTFNQVVGGSIPPWLTLWQMNSSANFLFIHMRVWRNFRESYKPCQLEVTRPMGVCSQEGAVTTDDRATARDRSKRSLRRGMDSAFVLSYYNILISQFTCGCGGIGRRARFRF